MSDYAMRHGDAVGIGIVAAARIAGKIGLADLALADRIEAVLAVWGLPTRCPAHEAGAIYEAMGRDKKKRSGMLRWVLPREIGVR